MTSRARRTIASILATLQLVGCATWQALPPSSVAEVFGPEQAAGSAGSGRSREVYRITLRSGEEVQLTGPSVRGDSIADQTRAVALADVERIDDRRFSAGRTVALLATPFLLAGAQIIAFAIGCSGNARCGD